MLADMATVLVCTLVSFVYVFASGLKALSVYHHTKQLFGAVDLQLRVNYEYLKDFGAVATSGVTWPRTHDLKQVIQPYWL